MKVFGFLASIFAANTPAAETKLIDPKSVLFSTPTLNDALPAFQPRATSGGRLLELHEDDWRQFEAVSAAYEREINVEFAVIREVRATATVKTKVGDRDLTAFRKIHVRKLITAPIESNVLRSRLAELADQRSEYSGLSLSGSPPVVGGYAFRIGEIIIFGQADGERVLSVCFTSSGSPKLDPGKAQSLADLLQKNGLTVVHWPSATTMEPRTAFLSFLTGGVKAVGEFKEPKARK